jgi:hypothetical protein
MLSCSSLGNSHVDVAISYYQPGFICFGSRSTATANRLNSFHRERYTIGPINNNGGTIGWKQRRHMTPENFDQLLQRRLTKCQEVLGSKAGEYAYNGDRLHNFRVAAQMNNEPMAKALWGMATKHLVSVQDLVKGLLAPTQHNVDEKIGDMINYLILLEAVLQECQEQNTRFPKHIDPYHEDAAAIESLINSFVHE